MFYSLARPDSYPRNPRIVRVVADLACCDQGGEQGGTMLS